MNDCIFCKIVNGEIPSHKVYEDDYVYAFLDITPATKGHTLVIPKKHCEDVFSLDEQLAGKIFESIPKIANAINNVFNPIGLNIVNNNQKPYQVVFHYHIHLIPRYEGDGFEITSKPKTFSNEEMENVRDMIIEGIKKLT